PPLESTWQQRNPSPPQTIIPDPSQACACCWRGSGAPAVEGALHALATGSYRPPVLTYPPPESLPPQTIISVPLQTARCTARPVGAPVVAVGVQESSAGS